MFIINYTPLLTLILRLHHRFKGKGNHIFGMCSVWCRHSERTAWEGPLPYLKGGTAGCVLSMCKTAPTSLDYFVKQSWEKEQEWSGNVWIVFRKHQDTWEQMQNAGICYSLWMQYDAVISVPIWKTRTPFILNVLSVCHCYSSGINAIIVLGPLYYKCMIIIIMEA